MWLKYLLCIKYIQFFCECMIFAKYTGIGYFSEYWFDNMVIVTSLDYPFGTFKPFLI
jgi:hypothetical protein